MAVSFCFLWEARPRGEAFRSAPAGSLLSPRGRGSHKKRIRAGYGCELLFFVGGPTSGRSFSLCAGRRLLSPRGRGSHKSGSVRAMAVSFCFLCGARPRGEAFRSAPAGSLFSPRGAAPTRSGSVQAMAVSFCFLCGRPDLGAKLLLCAGREFVFAAGARLPQTRVGTGYGCELLFLWEARPRGEAFGSAPAGSLLSPRGRGSHKSGSVQAMGVSFCFFGEARPRGESFALRRQGVCFRRGARLPQKRVRAGLCRLARRA